MVRLRTSRAAVLAHRSPRGLRRVLVALDGSPEGETVLAHLEGILSARTVLILVHVLPAPPPSSTRGMARLLHLQSHATDYLEQVSGRFTRLRSRVRVETGDPAQRILEAAREEDVDALAMTTHARSGLTSLLMGSVARRVVQQAALPVFLVRPDVPAPRRPLRHILVPLDGPKGSQPLLRIVENLAKQTGSKVTLLHVLPFPRVADPVTGFNPVVLKPLQLPEAAWLDSLVDLLKHHGVPAAKVVVAGEPEEVLLRESGARNVDLIALRTRGRGGIARLILGSVAEHVVRKAGRTVLLLHRVEE